MARLVQWLAIGIVAAVGLMGGLALGLGFIAHGVRGVGG